MATVALVAADRQYVVGLKSAFTTYPTYLLAQAAAITASAGASSAPYFVAKVEEVATGLRLDLVPGNPGPGVWIIQAASTANYLPKSAAEAQAFVTSASNANAPVFVAKTFQTVTGP